MMNLSRFQFKREKIAIQKIFHQFEIYDFILQTVQLESVQWKATKKKKKNAHTYPSMRISSWIEKVKRFVKLRLFISSCTDNFKLRRKTSKWWARTLQSANKIAYQDREFVVDILSLILPWLKWSSYLYRVTWNRLNTVKIGSL